MKTKTYTIEGVKLPTAFNSGIVTRMFKEPDLKDFWQAYQDARFTTRQNQPPTEQQRKIAEFVKGGASRSTAAAKFKVNTQKVAYCVQRVATYEFLNGK